MDSVSIYYVLIAMLFALAVFDLIVGVSNDAVNFLNSGIGAKAVSFKVLLTIAGAGVFIGAAFSNGMMDVARHGIFQPQYYYFSEILTILVAVMLTDVILLDIFNTLGMPTSTTVSMVFELLGASVAISVLKMANDPTGALNFANLINTSKALEVILGIFVSVAIAFTVGALVQYIARLLFTFGYKKNLKYFVGIFSAISLTSIFYFILIKGLKNASFISKDFQSALHSNEMLILLGIFAGFFILSHLLHAIGVNMLKVVIGCGTFALALAFAGNDLVNFVGVPLTGLSSLQHLIADGGNPDTYLMSALLDKEAGQWYLLMIAGAVMVITLVTSKKAHRVVQTSVSLSSQGETDEVFGTNPVARALVRFSYGAIKKINAICPRTVSAWIAKRFDTNKLTLEEDSAAFDLIRAGVNLMLASSLIAIGTSLKLPLSTTYVTFMVAMGTSLADHAWSRESAVYRITGVLSVIGGWFITAFAAFSACFIVAILLRFGGMPAQIILFAIVIFLLIRSNLKFKKTEKSIKKSEEIFSHILKASPETDVLPLVQKFSQDEWSSVLRITAENYGQIIEEFINDNLSELRTSKKRIKILKRYIERLRRQGTLCSKKMKQEDILVKNFFLYQANDFLGDGVFDIEQICIPCVQHLDNNFTEVNEKQKEKLEIIAHKISMLTKKSAAMIESGDFSAYDALVRNLHETSEMIVEERKANMVHEKVSSSLIRTEILYLTILYETRSYLDAVANLLKASRKFLTEKPEADEPALAPSFA